MDTSLFIGLTHKGALKRRMDVLAHNIANMNTTSFKAEKVMFQELLVDVPNATGTVGGKVSFIVDRGVTRDFSAGALVRTESPLDVYISDNGFISVQNDEGDTLFTRNGRMTINADNQLTLITGEKVLNTDGQIIQFEAGAENITIADTGQISAKLPNQPASEEVGTLSLVTFANPQSLERVGNSLYEAQFDPVPSTEEGDGQVLVTVGAIEASNVNTIKSMVEMIDVARSYERASKTGKDVEELQKDAIQRLGRMRA